MSHTINTSPVKSDGRVYCHAHNLLASRKVSQTSNNPGRAFYVCSFPQYGDPKRCTFFAWEDEIAGLPVPPSPQSPSPSQRFDRDQQASQLAPSPSLKRGRSGNATSISYNESHSQKKQKNIDDIFRPLTPQKAQKHVIITPGPSREHRHAHTDSDDDFADLPRALFKDGHGATRSPINFTVNVNNPPQNNERDHAQILDGDWTMLTPPPTSRRRRDELSREASPSPTRRKGKQRALSDDFDRGEGSSQNSSQTLRTPQPTDEMSSDKIIDMFQEMGSIVDYVRKLERKLLAAERSNEAKKHRIEELEAKFEGKGNEAENRRIKELEAELEKMRKSKRKLEEQLHALL